MRSGVPRVHATPHEKWWHVSLKIVPTGLQTDEMTAPDGRTFLLRLDLTTHDVVLAVNAEDTVRIDMTAGITGTEMGNSVIAAVAENQVGHCGVIENTVAIGIYECQIDAIVSLGAIDASQPTNSRSDKRSKRCACYPSCKTKKRHSSDYVHDRFDIEQCS